MSDRWGGCELSIQEDGNLVLKNRKNGKDDIIWECCSNPEEPDSYLKFQGDSNLVMYGSQGNAYWPSGTINCNAALLAVQNIAGSCELRLYNDNCKTVWKQPGDFRNCTRQVNAWPQRLDRGHNLNVDQRISIDDKCYLVMSKSGSLLHMHDGKVLFDSSLVCPETEENSIFRFTDDGHFDIYNPKLEAILCEFFKPPQDFGAQKLVLEDDCTLNIFGKSCDYLRHFP